MGQKVNPKGFRVGVIKDWDARWYANNKEFKNFLYEDYQLRRYVKEKLYASGVSKVDIERKGGRCPAGSRERGCFPGKTYRFPSGYEADCFPHHAYGCRRHQDYVRWPFGRR